MKKSFILKIIFFLFFFSLLCLGLFFVYNKDEEIFAQETKVIVCDLEDEVQIGQTINETELLADEIIENLKKIADASWDQVKAADEMVVLVDQCGVDNCSTACYLEPYDCNPQTCNPHPCEGDADINICYDLCWETCYNCIAPPCAGVPCPPEIALKLKKVQVSAQKIKQAYQIIKDVFEKAYPEDVFEIKLLGRVATRFEGCEEVFDCYQICPPPETGLPCAPSPTPHWCCKTKPEIILEMRLEKSIEKLEYCVVDYEKLLNEEESAKWLLNCENVLGRSLLDKCYPNNFYCCE